MAEVTRAVAPMWGRRIVLLGFGLMVVATGVWAKTVPVEGRERPPAVTEAGEAALPDDSGLLLPEGKERLEEQIRTARRGPDVETERLPQSPAPGIDPSGESASEIDSESQLAGPLVWALALGVLGTLGIAGTFFAKRRRGVPVSIGAHRFERTMILRRADAAAEKTVEADSRMQRATPRKSRRKLSAEDVLASRTEALLSAAGERSAAEASVPVGLESRPAARPVPASDPQVRAGAERVTAGGTSEAPPSAGTDRPLTSTGRPAAGTDRPVAGADRERMARLETSVLTLAETIRDLSERIPTPAGPEEEEASDWENHMIELLDLDFAPAHQAHAGASPTSAASPWEHFLAEQGEALEITTARTEPQSNPEPQVQPPLRIVESPTFAEASASILTAAEAPSAPVRATVASASPPIPSESGSESVSESTIDAADSAEAATRSGASDPTGVSIGAGSGTGAARSWVRSRPDRRESGAPSGDDLEQMRDHVLDLAGRGVPVPEICEKVGLGRHEVQLILRTLFEERRTSIQSAESGTDGR